MARVALYVFGPLVEFLLAFSLAQKFVQLKPMKISREASLKALSHLQEWAKWMSGIETAVLGGLIALLFKCSDGQHHPLCF